MTQIFCKLLWCTALAASLTTFTLAQTRNGSGSPSLPSDAEIRQLLVDRVDVQHKSVGIVVGIITPQGRRTISYGQLNQGDARQLNGDTTNLKRILTAIR